jgi:hypothetical protein
VNLLSSDGALKALVYRAEIYHILIRKGDVAAFRKRMESFGYLLPRL